MFIELFKEKGLSVSIAILKGNRGALAVITMQARQSEQCLLARCKSTIINHHGKGNGNHCILIYCHNTFHINLLTRIGNLDVFSMSLCSKHTSPRHHLF